MHKPIFGVLLRKMRRSAHMTQEDLALRSGYSLAYIGALERGTREPHTVLAEQFAQALGVSAADRAQLLAAALPAAEPTYRSLATALTPLVGRRRTLDAMLAHLQPGAPGAQPLLMVVGEPGIGKTRLLQEALSMAQEFGYRVLVGGCNKGSADDMYAPLTDALATYLEALSPYERDLVLAPSEWLIPLFPHLNLPHSLPDARIAQFGHSEQRLLMLALKRFLTTIEGTSGTVIVLDDLQWANCDALDLLAALLQQASPRLRVIAAYRDTDIRDDNPLPTMMATLSQAGLVTHCHLGPLSDDESARLLEHVLDVAQSQVSDHVADNILRRAGGLPFALVTWARAVQDGPDLASGLMPLPAGVAESVRQRLSPLSPPARVLLSLAAVIGRDIPYTLLPAIALLPPDDLDEALRELCRARILQIEGVGHHYRFTHDIVWETIAADIGAHQRVTYHDKIATALIKNAADVAPATIATHLVGAGAFREAVPYLEDAGDRAMRQLALETAQHYYVEALARLESAREAGHEAALNQKLGETLKRLGHYDEAIVALSRARDAYHMLGDIDAQATTTAEMGVVLTQRGDMRQAIAQCRALLAEWRDRAPSDGLYNLYRLLSYASHMAGDYEDSLTAARQQMAIAHHLQRSDFILSALSSMASVQEILGHYDEALSAFQEALPIAETSGLVESVARILMGQSITLMSLNRPTEALASFARTLQAQDKLGDAMRQAYTYSWRAKIYITIGDWHQAHVDLQAARLAMDSQPQSVFHISRLHSAVQLAIAEGDWDDAQSLLADMAARVERTANVEWEVSTAELGGLLGLLRRDYEGARAHIEVMRQRRDKTIYSGILTLLEAWLSLDMGDIGQARAYVVNALDLMRARHDQQWLCDALRVASLIAAREGDWYTARHHAREGIAMARAIVYPLAEGRLWHASAALRALQGQHAAAMHDVQQARDIFARLGAQWAIDDIARDEATWQTAVS